jgi:hypothetical protein
MPALPGTEFEFPGQGPHAAADTAAVLALYKLSPQSVQASEPAVALCDPAAHAEHVPPSGPVNPGLHTQLVCAVDATTADCELVAQSVHGAEPGAVLYFPDTHAVHVPPLGPVYPVLHEQLCTTVLPLAETEFTGHCRHTALGCFHPFKLLQRFFQ